MMLSKTEYIDFGEPIKIEFTIKYGWLFIGACAIVFLGMLFGLYGFIKLYFYVESLIKML